MIKKLHDEWEKLSEEARVTADQDPERMKHIAERMTAVSAAMQKMSQASVTRTTLSQAVRDSLREILKSEPVLPEVVALQKELEQVRQLVAEKLAAPRPEPFSPKALETRIEGVSSGLDRLMGRMGSLEKSVASAGESLNGDLARGIAELGSKGSADAKSLEERFKRIGSSLERLEGRLGTLEGSIASSGESLHGAIAGEIAGLGSKVDEGEFRAFKDRFEGVAANIDHLSGRIVGFEDSLKASGPNILKVIAEEMGTLESKSASEIQTLKGRFEGAVLDIDRLAGRIGGFEETLARTGEGLHGALGQELATIEARAGGEIQELKDRFAQELEALKGSLIARLDEVESRAASGAEARNGTEARLAKLEEAALEARALGQEFLARAGALSEDLRGRAEGLERELSRRLEEAGASLAMSAGDLGGRLEDQASRIAALGQDLASADDHLAEGLKDLESRLGGRITTLETDSTSRIEAMEGNLQNNLAAAETRLTEAQGQLETRFTGEMQDIAGRLMEDLSARIAKIEDALPELRGMEARLQREMEMAMERIAERMNSLVDMVSQIQTTLPPREVFTGMDERLDRLETRFRSISDLLGDLEGTVPELRSLGDRLAGLREEIAGLLSEVTSSQKDAHGASELFARKIQDVQDLLRSLLERWSADRSNFRQRLVDLRDTLRDQIQSAIHASDGVQSQNTFWGKLMAKPDGGLRFGMEEWERFRARLETILQGIESLVGEAK